ncbi:DUF2325 domain-containing protein [Bacillus sp. FSL W8-1127]|uniref:DUF2325 domain-containing protein n=1 Tax=Bacillus sp. FSL W8-1127 TaxID=2954710 RepID=UPI0030FB00A4
MGDIRPYFKVKTHVTVWLHGRCKYCNFHNEKKIYDYGVLTLENLEKKMDEVKHPIVNLVCKKCGSESTPEALIYRDELSGQIISDVTINYGHTIEGVQSQEVENAHQNRYKIFEKNKDEFWEKYTDYAIANWRDVVNELQDFEIREAYQKLGIGAINARTVLQYRRDVLNRFKTIEEKQSFWKAANEYFVYTHLLDIGPLGWIVNEDAKEFGPKRMRFIVLHFPLGEALEGMRTEWIGQLVRKEKGDNAFLFRRIAMLTDELSRTRQKITKYVHQIEELKAEQAKLQNRLASAYEDIRKLREEKHVFTRDPADIQKIHELKSFVGELINELKEKDRLIHELQPAQEEIVVPQLEETQGDVEQETLDVLSEKTVAIIGGRRQEQAKREYSCTILTHTGETFDPDFYQALKQADIIIVLTQFISHSAMWEAKAFAIENNVPIFFLKGVNIPKLLNEISAMI